MNYLYVFHTLFKPIFSCKFIKPKGFQHETNQLNILFTLFKFSKNANINFKDLLIFKVISILQKPVKQYNQVNKIISIPCNLRII